MSIEQEKICAKLLTVPSCETANFFCASFSLHSSLLYKIFQYKKPAAQSQQA